MTRRWHLEDETHFNYKDPRETLARFFWYFYRGYCFKSRSGLKSLHYCHFVTWLQLVKILFISWLRFAFNHDLLAWILPRLASSAVPYSVEMLLKAPHAIPTNLISIDNCQEFSTLFPTTLTRSLSSLILTVRIPHLFFPLIQVIHLVQLELWNIMISNGHCPIEWENNQ